VIESGEAAVRFYRHLGNNAHVGVGYNFVTFSDDATDLSRKRRRFHRHHRDILEWALIGEVRGQFRFRHSFERRGTGKE